MLRFGLLNKGGVRPFNGGLFVNGGFEDGFSGWLNQPSGSAWQATPDADTVQNSDNVAGRFAYQSFTLEAGATYEISADKISGDAVITYCIDDADSGADIEAGPHQFLGHGGLMSYGITLSVAGTGTTVCDNVRLKFVSNACTGFDLCMTVGKSDTTEMYGFAPSAPTPYGAMIPSQFMGIDIYNFNFNSTNGTCAVSMGDVGDDMVGDYEQFITTISGYPNGDVLFVWDVDQTRYKVVDLDLATYIKDNLGKKIGITAVPAIDVITYNGEIVTYNGNPVTYTKEV